MKFVLAHQASMVELLFTLFVFKLNVHQEYGCGVQVSTSFWPCTAFSGKNITPGQNCIVERNTNKKRDKSHRFKSMRVCKNIGYTLL